MHPALCFALVLTFLNPRCNPQSGIDSDRHFMTVLKVVDGDTFWVQDGPETFKVRLIGIDAPEPRNAFRKKEQPFGKEASAYMEKLIAGKKISLQYDVGKFDRYGRTLAYAYLEDGTFINAQIVADGFATVMTVPPNVKFADEFVKLQKRARKAKRGLWAGK